MHDSSEAPAREENQIGDPPLTSQQVCLCITFFVRLCITFSDLVLEETQIGEPPLPPQGTCIFVDIGIYFFLCSLIVSKWCLKSTQSGSLLVRHHDPPLLTPYSN